MGLGLGVGVGLGVSLGVGLGLGLGLGVGSGLEVLLRHRHRFDGLSLRVLARYALRRSLAQIALRNRQRLPRRRRRHHELRRSCGRLLRRWLGLVGLLGRGRRIVRCLAGGAVVVVGAGIGVVDRLPARGKALRLGVGRLPGTTVVVVDAMLRVVDGLPALLVGVRVRVRARVRVRVRV